MQDGTATFGRSHETVAITSTKIVNPITVPTNNDDEASTSKMLNHGKSYDDNSVFKEKHLKYRKSMMSDHDDVEDMADVKGIHLSSGKNNLEFLNHMRNKNSRFISDSTDNKEEEYQKCLELDSGSELVVKDAISQKKKDNIDQEKKDKINYQNLELEKKNFNESVMSSTSLSSYNICMSNGPDQEINAMDHPVSFNPGAHYTNTSESMQFVAQSNYDDMNSYQEIYDINHDSSNNAIHNNLHPQVDSMISISGNDLSNAPSKIKPSQVRISCRNMVTNLSNHIFNLTLNPLLWSFESRNIYYFSLLTN